MFVTLSGRVYPISSPPFNLSFYQISKIIEIILFTKNITFGIC